MLYRTLINHDTDTTHTLDPSLIETGQYLTLCGQVGGNFRRITVSAGQSRSQRRSVTCKNCLRSLGAYTFQRKRINRTMKVYEFGEHDSEAEPTWIRTDKNIRLTSAAKRTGKYLKEIRSSFKGAAGIDLVIT